MSPRGTKVYSATEGLIADLRNNNLGGKVIWILGPVAAGTIMPILMGTSEVWKSVIILKGTAHRLRRQYW